MNARIAGSVAFVMLVLGMAHNAHAQCLGCFVQSIERDFARRNCWPEPFIYPDRDAARAPWGIMTSNGWERQNLLIDMYFEENGARLTDAGRTKLNWILFEAPPQHRVVYVHRSIHPEETATRMATVQTYVSSLWQGSAIPPILPSAASQDGWPADRVDLVNKKFLQAIPAPKLPASSQGGGGGSSGGTP